MQFSDYSSPDKQINFDKLDRYLIKQHDEEKKKQKKLDGKVVAVDL